jgi:hypothetical protein
VTQRTRFIMAAAFFLVAGVIGAFFSYAGLDAANKWSSVISMFLALASFVLSTLLFRQSTAVASSIPSTPGTASKYSIINDRTGNLSIGDHQKHNTTINKVYKGRSPH